MDFGRAHTPAAHDAAVAGQPAYQAYQILRFGFTLLPIIAGLDKFFDRLTEWEMYLAPVATQVVPVTSHALMLTIGVIEIIAGLIVAVRPRIGAYIVTLWLWAIVVNLLLARSFYDIALRDFGLSLGALALARLSHEFDLSVKLFPRG
jgi:hypothetical protein